MIPIAILWTSYACTHVFICTLTHEYTYHTHIHAHIYMHMYILFWGPWWILCFRFYIREALPVLAFSEWIIFIWLLFNWLFNYSCTVFFENNPSMDYFLTIWLLGKFSFITLALWGQPEWCNIIRLDLSFSGVCNTTSPLCDSES